MTLLFLFIFDKCFAPQMFVDVPFDNWGSSYPGAISGEFLLFFLIFIFPIIALWIFSDKTTFFTTFLKFRTPRNILGLENPEAPIPPELDSLTPPRRPVYSSLPIVVILTVIGTVVVLSKMNFRENEPNHQAVGVYLRQYDFPPLYYAEYTSPKSIVRLDKDDNTPTAIVKYMAHPTSDKPEPVAFWQNYIGRDNHSQIRPMQELLFRF